jgi:hypothetical protein
MRPDPSLLASRVARIRAARAWHMGVLDPAADALPEPGAETPAEPEECPRCDSREVYHYTRHGKTYLACRGCDRARAARNKKRKQERRLSLRLSLDKKGKKVTA